MSTASPLVSALIPCFNAERWASEAIDSALAQTWPNIEVIVVEDGLTDRSAEIVEGYGYRGIQLIAQANREPSAARNRVEMIKGISGAPALAGCWTLLRQQIEGRPRSLTHADRASHGG